MRFLAYVTLFDGHVSRNQVYLTLGNFRVDNDEKRLPLDVYDKIALYIILAAKYGIGVRTMYIVKSVASLLFDREYAEGMFSLVWAELSRLWSFGVENGLYADHIFNKLNHIRRYVEEYVNKLRIEYTLYSPPGVDPWVEVRFRDDRGDEIAHINIRWHRNELRAFSASVREKAERLASILNALGASVEAKEYDEGWRVEFTTDSITAIRRKEWLEAVRALVEELYRRNIINDVQKNRLLTDIYVGPNKIEIAGIKFNIEESKTDNHKWLAIGYWPKTTKSFNTAINTLKSAGFEEGIHFTAKRPEGGKRGYIRLKVPAGLWRLEELRRQGVEWADKALQRLEEIAKAKGFSDLLENYLKPAREAETINLKDITVEDVKKGIRAIIRSVRVEWENNRPRVVVEYEINGEVNTFSFIWGVITGGRIRASVKLNDERALVIAALTGDEIVKEKRGNVVLTTNHLLALVKYEGIGWKLLWWYASVIGA
ncbi:PaRep2b protein [Pyrobaculum aerophilum]|uniref:PaRep2b protein n=1 Tax=Pyrobaculum aerophilum TaxID=13773 RepID=UPI002FD975C4